MVNANAAGNGISGPAEKKKPQISPQKVELIQKDMTGEVRFFNRVQGWGFIIQDSDQPDAFVHYSQIISDKKFKKLKGHDFVLFDLYKIIKNGKESEEEDKENKSKFQARNVRKIKETLFD